MSAPPPPPGNLPKFSINITNSKPPALPNTSILLKSIEKGTKLKKTVTNDRSAPLISNQKNSAAPNKSSQESTTSYSNTTSTNSASLGGLFANGFPTLRSAKKQASDSEKPEKPHPKPISGFKPDILKKPGSNFAQNAAEIVSRNPEKALNVAKKGGQVLGPVIISEANKQLGNHRFSVEIPNSVRAVGNKTEMLSSKTSIPNNGNQERWHFAIEEDGNLPNPRKYTGCKKNYISETIKASGKHSKSTIQDEVTESDIKGFIKTLKSKIDKAASKEDFEECVRLKSKLKSFEAIEKRIKSGEQISVTELQI
jgi:hypothetical protein